MRSSTPSIAVSPTTRPTGDVKAADPVNAYMNGYFDAIGSVDKSIIRYVTSLRLMGWKDQDILKALLIALHSYSTGSGIEATFNDILKKYTGKERLGRNG